MGVFTVQNPGIGIFQLTAAEEAFLTSFANLTYSEGHVLTIVSGTPAWAAPTGGGGAPGGVPFEIQFNDSGAFGGMEGTEWDSTNRILYISDGISGYSGQIREKDGNNVQGFGFYAGNRTSSGTGGNMNLFAGAGYGSGQGGAYNVYAGSGGSTGKGGDIIHQTGYSGGGNNNGGDYITQLGEGSGTGRHGLFNILSANTGFGAILDIYTIASSSKTFTFPNKSGTFALLDDVSSVELQTNSTDNASQATLNLVEGDYIQLTNTSGGNVQFDVDPHNELVKDAEVRGSATNLNARLNVISNFASPNAGGIVSHGYYDNSFHGTNSTNGAGVADNCDLAPFYTSVDMAIKEVGIAVVSGVAGSAMKVVIYQADSAGWPDTLVLESNPIATISGGYKFDTVSFTFKSGVQYWVGFRYSAAVNVRLINVSSAVNLGLATGASNTYNTIIRRSITFASAAPSTWGFTSTELVAGAAPPSVRFFTN